MLRTGWIMIDCGNLSWTALDDLMSIIEYSPIHFSVSFFDGHFRFKFSISGHTFCPTSYFGDSLR
jgi:hypothetical protein